MHKEDQDNHPDLREALNNEPQQICERPWRKLRCLVQFATRDQNKSEQSQGESFTQVPRIRRRRDLEQAPTLYELEKPAVSDSQTFRPKSQMICKPQSTKRTTSEC